MEKTKFFSNKLDKISENIIYLLSIDSRQTISSLADTLKVNRNIVETRLKNLFKYGYIRYLTITNEKRRIRFTMLIKLKDIEDNIFERLKQMPALIKLKETFGVYDLSVLFDAYSNEEMEKTISSVSNLLHNRILAFDVIPHEFEDTLGYKSFCHDPAFFQKYKLLSQKPITFSKNEELVLNILKKETNISLKKLAEKTKISFITLKAIQQKLEEENIIRYSIDPNYTKLGLEFHNMFVKINVGKRDQFEKYVITHPRVHWIKRCTGKWDYVLSITSKDLNELAEITKEIRTQNKNIILEEATLISHIREARRI